MNPKLKEAIFEAESLAHFQGYEWYILPVTDSIKQMNEAIQAYLNPSIDRKQAHDMLVNAFECKDIRFE